MKKSHLNHLVKAGAFENSEEIAVPTEEEAQKEEASVVGVEMTTAVTEADTGTIIGITEGETEGLARRVEISEEIPASPDSNEGMISQPK